MKKKLGILGESLTERGEDAGSKTTKPGGEKHIKLRV